MGKHHKAVSAPPQCDENHESAGPSVRPGSSSRCLWSELARLPVSVSQGSVGDPARGPHDHRRVPFLGVKHFPEGFNHAGATAVNGFPATFCTEVLPVAAACRDGLVQGPSAISSWTTPRSPPSKPAGAGLRPDRDRWNGRSNQISQSCRDTNRHTRRPLSWLPSHLPHKCRHTRRRVSTLPSRPAPGKGHPGSHTVARNGFHKVAVTLAVTPVDRGLGCRHRCRHGGRRRRQGRSQPGRSCRLSQSCRHTNRHVGRPVSKLPSPVPSHSPTGFAVAVTRAVTGPEPAEESGPRQAAPGRTATGGFLGRRGAAGAAGFWRTGPTGRGHL